MMADSSKPLTEKQLKEVAKKANLSKTVDGRKYFRHGGKLYVETTPGSSSYEISKREVQKFNSAAKKIYYGRVDQRLKARIEEQSQKFAAAREAKSGAEPKKPVGRPRKDGTPAQSKKVPKVKVPIDPNVEKTLAELGPDKVKKPRASLKTPPAAPKQKPIGEPSSPAGKGAVKKTAPKPAAKKTVKKATQPKPAPKPAAPEPTAKKTAPKPAAAKKTAPKPAAQKATPKKKPVSAPKTPPTAPKPPAKGNTPKKGSKAPTGPSTPRKRASGGGAKKTPAQARRLPGNTFEEKLANFKNIKPSSAGGRIVSIGGKLVRLAGRASVPATAAMLGYEAAKDFQAYATNPKTQKERNQRKGWMNVDLSGSTGKKQIEQSKKNLQNLITGKDSGKRKPAGTTANMKPSQPAKAKSTSQRVGKAAPRNLNASDARAAAMSKKYAPTGKGANRPSTPMTGKVIRIKRGDTLWDIAQKNKTTVASLYKANPELAKRKAAGKTVIYSNTVVRVPRKK